MTDTTTTSKIRIKFAVMLGLFFAIHLSAYLLQMLGIDHPIRSWAIIPAMALILFSFFIRCEKCGTSLLSLSAQPLDGSIKKFGEKVGQFIFHKRCPVCQLERK